MRFFSKCRYVLCLLVLACAFSCGDDNKNDNGGNGGDGPTGSSPLTPDQHKAQLETIGKDFISKFNPNDHKDVVDAIDYLSNIIDDLGFVSGDEEAVPSPEIPYPDYMKQTLSDIRAIVSKNDLNGLANLATRSSADIYTLAEFAGIYTYDSGAKEWNEKEATGKISLEYNNGKACVLTMTFEDEQDYTQVDGVIVKIPGKVNFSMKVGGIEQINISVGTALAKDQKSAEVSVKMSLIGGYEWVFEVNATNSVVTESYTMAKGNETLISSTAKLTGNKLTSPDDIENGEAGDMLSNGEFKFSIMNVAISGKGDIKAIIDGVNKIPDGLSEKEETTLESAIYNQYMKVELYYTNNSEKVADVQMKPYYDGQGYEYQYNPQTGQYDRTPCEYYVVMPELVFASDGSRYDLDTYFSEANFGSLIESVKTLANKYADLLGTDHVDW